MVYGVINAEAMNVKSCVCQQNLELNFKLLKDSRIIPTADKRSHVDGWSFMGFTSEPNILHKYNDLLM